MRLLKYDSSRKRYVTLNVLDDIPPYAILSHTWGTDEEEVKHNELSRLSSKKKAGYKKIEFCGQQAEKDEIQYFWVDTCCIDKANHVELSEAITSMFRWYQRAEICYVYLSDVSFIGNNGSSSSSNDYTDLSQRSWVVSFRKSRWFTRGWTLQELVAPKNVVFFSQEGIRLGTKVDLEDLLHDITGIPVAALRGSPLSQFSIDERMRWTKGRTTKRKEDQAYCLLGIFDIFMPLIYGEGDNAFIRLVEELNKAPRAEFNLRVVEGAMFDAYGQVHQECHPKTRVEVLKSIRDWAQDANGKSIFWLNGMAGTGKSTISWTFSKWLKGLDSSGPVVLGASFFFKRGEGDQASAKLLFPTIAIQLAACIKGFGVFLSQSTQADPQICSKSLGEQFDKLIRDPLRQLRCDTRYSAYVVVIDALDECDNEVDIRTVLQLWQTLPAALLPRLRVFLTSRPELVIRLGFMKMPGGIHDDMILHEVPQSIIRHDIYAFLTDALAQARDDYNLEAVEDVLADDWPGTRLLGELTDIAVPLFIVAATIFRLICDAPRPEEGLQTVLWFRKAGLLSNLGQMYEAVLHAMAASVRVTVLKDKLYHGFRTVVGAIVCLREPLSRIALADLLEVSSSDIRIQLQPLHAVLLVPTDGSSLIRPLHLSFPEYLTGPEAERHPFGVRAEAAHSSLWKHCLRLLSDHDGLREDICGLKNPGTLRADVPLDLVSRHIRPAMQYACRYWVDHVVASDLRAGDEDEICTFLREHFLHWLEALSLLDHLVDSISLIDKLSLQFTKDNSSPLNKFLGDAKRFVLANRFIGELAPLQLHSSAVLFAPEESIVKRNCGHTPAWILQCPLTPLTWGDVLQKLEGHTSSVNAVTFSPDNSLLISASDDATARLWNPSTGQEIQLFEGHTDEIFSIAISHDGSLLATASEDDTIRVWNIFTSQQIYKLQGRVSAIAFSHNGLCLASASSGSTIRLWDLSNGQEIRNLNGHHSVIYAVTFSVDDSLLASASRDGTVRLWRPSLGQELYVLHGHSRHEGAMALSHNGLLLAAASDRYTVRLWNLATALEWRELDGRDSHLPTLTIAFSYDDSLIAVAGENCIVKLWDTSSGQILRELKGQASLITQVAFARDSLLLASGSADRTIWLWDPWICDDIPHPRLRDQIEEVVFSYDGLMLASASTNASIVLWEAFTGKEICTLEGHSDQVPCVVFSHDNSLLVSASADGTICLWDVNTCQRLRQLKGHTKSVRRVAFSHSDLILASASDDMTVRLWDLSTGRELQKPIEHVTGVAQINFSHDDLLLVSAMSSLRKQPMCEELRLWDLSTATELPRIAGDETLVVLIDAIALSIDGSLLGLASFDQDFSHVYLRNRHTGEVVQLVDNWGDIDKMRFAADGNSLITNRGTIEFGVPPSSSSLSQVAESITYPGLFLEHNWVTYKGNKILWLPPDYRMVTDVHENKIAFGQDSGHVSIMRIDLAALELILG